MSSRRDPSYRICIHGGVWHACPGQANVHSSSCTDLRSDERSDEALFFPVALRTKLRESPIPPSPSGEKIPQVAIPTHRSTFGRPTKSLGRFEKCLLQLSENSDGAKLDEGPKRNEGNKGRKKKPRMALRIELRPKVGGSLGEAPAMQVGLASGPTEGPESGVEAVRERSLPSADAATSQQRRAESAAADPVAVCINDPQEAELVETTGRAQGSAEASGEGTTSSSGAAEENGSGRGARAGSGDARLGDQGAPSPVGLAGGGRTGPGGASLGDQGVPSPARQPSGALKREREDGQALAPHPAAFFRTREGYAVVNKRGPDLAGREGNRRRTECSCCLQRERASGTWDLLPAVTVHQAIGHLPKLARSAEMVSRADRLSKSALERKAEHNMRRVVVSDEESGETLQDV